MRHITFTTTVYTFDELSDRAKENAVSRLCDINVDYEWWDCTYEDAARVGLKITGFDVGRGNSITGDFTESADECAEMILVDHGEGCETFKTASAYLASRGELVSRFSDGVDTDAVAEGNEYDFDCECDELDREFKRDLLEDYLSILRNEYEYLTSEEAIIETILANEYEFDEDGMLA